MARPQLATGPAKSVLSARVIKVFSYYGPGVGSGEGSPPFVYTRTQLSGLPRRTGSLYPLRGLIAGVGGINEEP